MMTDQEKRDAEAMLRKVFPVGATIQMTEGTEPATTLGFGAWEPLPGQETAEGYRTWRRTA